MNEISEAFLLDTHTWVWVQQGDARGARAATVIEAARAEEGAFVSAISVWELGILEKAGRVVLSHPLEEWLSMAYSVGRLRCVPVSSEIALLTTRLPGDIHRDPADRILAATARLMNLTLLTRDEALLAYARQGYLRARKI